MNNRTRYILIWERKNPMTGDYSEHAKTFIGTDAMRKFCAEMQDDPMCRKYAYYYIGRKLGSFERTTR